MNRLPFIISIIVALTIYFFLHYFAYGRVANGLGLSAPKRLSLKIGLALAALSFILAEAFGRSSWVAPLLYMWVPLGSASWSWPWPCSWWSGSCR